MNYSLLREKNFSILVMSGFISLIGTEMLNFSLSLYVLQTTHSATLFSTVLAISIIPVLALGPFGGVIIDWIDQKKIIVLLDFCSGTVVLFFTLYFLKNNYLSITNIYIFTILLSIISSVYTPTIGTIIPLIIKEDNLIDANSLNRLFKNFAIFFSPILAGIIFGFYGLLIVLFIDCISFYLSGISEVFISISKSKTKNIINFKSFFSNFYMGLKFIGNNNILKITLIIGIIINFLYDPIINIGFIYICNTSLKLSDFYIGLLNSIIAISMIVSPFLCKRILNKFSLIKIMLLDLFVIALCLSILGVILNIYSNDFPLISYISLIIVGFITVLISSVISIALTTTIQNATNKELLGRINSLFSTVLISITPIGQILFGFLFNYLPDYLCILIASSILLIMTILILSIIKLYKIKIH